MWIHHTYGSSIHQRMIYTLELRCLNMHSDELVRLYAPSVLSPKFYSSFLLLNFFHMFYASKIMPLKFSCYHFSFQFKPFSHLGGMLRWQNGKIPGKTGKFSAKTENLEMKKFLPHKIVRFCRVFFVFAEFSSS